MPPSPCSAGTKFPAPDNFEQKPALDSASCQSQGYRKANVKYVQSEHKANAEQAKQALRNSTQKPCNHSAKSKASAEQREQAQNKRWASAEQAQSKHGASVEQGKSSLLQALSSAKPKVSNILATCCLCENAAEPPPRPMHLAAKALTPYNFKLSCPHRLAQLVPSFHLPTTLSRSQHLTQLSVNRKAIPKQTQNTCRANTKQTRSKQSKH